VGLAPPAGTAVNGLARTIAMNMLTRTVAIRSLGRRDLRTLPRRQTRSARIMLASLVLATPSAIHGYGLPWSLSFGRAAEVSPVVN